MLKLRKASERVNTLKTIGTVAEFAGVGGSQELASETNFLGTVDTNGNRTLKQVSIKVTAKNGDYEYINCSKAVGAWLRESKTKQEIKQRLAEVALLPILELPQFNRDENDPNYGQPVMTIDKETGEEKQLVLYAISFTGGSDMSETRTMITEDMLKAEAVKRAINFEDLIAI
jgi:hypothetical protein